MVNEPEALLRNLLAAIGPICDTNPVSNVRYVECPCCAERTPAGEVYTTHLANIPHTEDCGWKNAHDFLFPAAPFINERVETAREKWLRFKELRAAGKFDPSGFNWAVGENAIWDQKTEKFLRRTCIYIMGDGSEQVVAEFPMLGDPSPERVARAKAMIRETFGVERILDGV